LVPTEKMIDAAKVVSATRADSLEFRFRHEDALMERAKERFVFGWGGYNRSRVHDPKTGQDLSTVDGFWIITTGTRGIMGFACVFGLLLFPIFNAYRRLSRIPNRRDQALIAAVSLMIIMYAVDMIPNGLWLFLPFYLAGALEGITRSLAKAGTRVRKPRLRQNGPSAMQARA